MLLTATLRHWHELIRTLWPACFEQCPKAAEAVVLDGSRSTPKGWKVSYHVVFPWVVFPNNNTSLKQIVQMLSEEPALHYLTSSGERKP